MEQKQEVRLVDEIAQMLIDAGHEFPLFWLKGLPKAAVDEALGFDRQRFIINTHWEMILGSEPSRREMPEDYIEKQLDARYCLLPQGTRKVWLDSFKSGVLPIVMKYQIGIV